MIEYKTKISWEIWEMFPQAFRDKIKDNFSCRGFEYCDVSIDCDDLEAFYNRKGESFYKSYTSEGMNWDLAWDKHNELMHVSQKLYHYLQMDLAPTGERVLLGLSDAQGAERRRPVRWD
jgi:hypothetical protein